MTRILITGGNGMLGRSLTEPLLAAGYTIRVSSRGPRAANAKPGVEWAQASLETGEGLDDALTGVDIVLHCATGGYTKAKVVDIEGTKRLMALAKQHDIQHLLFISIIGVDKIPNPFMDAKYEAEQIIKASGVPYTILRAAQFYGEFITPLLKIVTKPPVGLIPKGFAYQPIDIHDVVTRMVELVKAGPNGQVPDIAGPRTYQLIDLARSWLRAQGKRKPLLQIPVPGKFGAATRAGYGTAPDQATHGLTWEAWLQREYGGKT